MSTMMTPMRNNVLVATKSAKTAMAGYGVAQPQAIEAVRGAVALTTHLAYPRV